jgi:hypothetical protein
MTLEAFTAFLAAPAGLALKAMLLWAFLDFATGTFAAAKDGTFALDAIGAFIRKHILGRVGPIAVLLAAAHFTGDLALAGGAIAAATAYTLETMGSVKGNFFPPKDSDVLTAEEEAAGVSVISTPVNPVPTD